MVGRNMYFPWNISRCRFLIWLSWLVAIFFLVNSLFLPRIYFERLISFTNHKDKKDETNFAGDGSSAVGLTIICNNGQLGNKMFSYAVLYGVARLNHRKPYLQACNMIGCFHNLEECPQSSLDQFFHLSLPVGTDLPRSQWRGHPIHFHSTFPSDYLIPRNANILTREVYPCSVTHFLHVQDQIRKEFTFRDGYYHSAQKKLLEIKGSRSNVTFVGVHVRRTSYLYHLRIFNRKEAPLAFYRYGFSYYRRLYPNVQFLVVSDDIGWCIENLSQNDVHMNSNQQSTPAEDMALLSVCNHSLFDYGTFAFWGAFLAGGQAVYYVDGIVDPDNNNVLIAKRMYPPEWIGISDNMLDAMANCSF